MKGKHAFTETMRFEVLPDGSTRVHDALKMHMSIPRFIRSIALKFVLITQRHYDKALALAAQIANEEFTKIAGHHDAIGSTSLSISLQEVESKR